MSATSKKKLRNYSEDFLKFGFIPAEHDKSAPFCLICRQCLTNESMKAGRLENHLRAKHPSHASQKLVFFKSLKEKYARRLTVNALFGASSTAANRSQEASYEISLLIAKAGKNHSVGEQLVKPAISAFLKTVLQMDDAQVKNMPLSNNTVCRRIDEMGEDVEEQLITKLRGCPFSLQLDESTICDSEALLLAYVRYVDKEDISEEMLFCKSLETSTTAKDIFKVVYEYINENDIPFKNIVSCTADGAPAMMGKQTGCLKLLKDMNPSMMTFHCVVHRENLVAKNMSPSLHTVMQAVIRCVNSIKAKPKFERLFKQFCLKQEADHVRLLLHTEVRWLSKGNCLRRFMEMFDMLTEFLGDQEEIIFLSSVDGKAFVSYLTDIFEKLNILNCQLQGSKTTLLDAKTKIFGFVRFLETSEKNVRAKQFTQFEWLKKCKVTNGAVKVISEHLNTLISDFNERFSDLKNMHIPSWLGQPFLVDLNDVEIEFQEELAELQCNQSMETLFKAKGVLMWLSDDMKKNYPKTTSRATEFVIHFPSSYLVECGFSAVNQLTSTSRNRLEITKRGDLRLKLTNLVPRIKSLCKNHEASFSH